VLYYCCELQWHSQEKGYSGDSFLYYFITIWADFEQSMCIYAAISRSIKLKAGHKFLGSVKYSLETLFISVISLTNRIARPRPVVPTTYQPTIQHTWIVRLRINIEGRDWNRTEIDLFWTETFWKSWDRNP